MKFDLTIKIKGLCALVPEPIPESGRHNLWVIVVDQRQRRDVCSKNRNVPKHEGRIVGSARHVVNSSGTRTRDANTINIAPAGTTVRQLDLECPSGCDRTDGVTLVDFNKIANLGQLVSGARIDSELIQLSHPKSNIAMMRMKLKQGRAFPSSFESGFHFVKNPETKNEAPAPHETELADEVTVHVLDLDATANNPLVISGLQRKLRLAPKIENDSVELTIENLPPPPKETPKARYGYHFSRYNFLTREPTSYCIVPKRTRSDSLQVQMAAGDAFCPLVQIPP